MTSFILFFLFVLSTASATSPIINETNDCIVPDSKPVNIPRRCPPNEVLKSKPPCPPDTCNMLYVSVLCIANQTESVVCTCKDGYKRTNSTPTGVCVPQDRCLPPKQCTQPHERYSTCLLGECVPKTCGQLGYPIACPSIASPCAGGCICEDGYVYDSNGDCIEKSKCGTCGGNRNAVSGCGNPCGKTCDSLYTNISGLICPQYCEYNGCDCKPGYRLLNAESKKCIPEAECPKPTNQCKGPHEEYVDCPAGQCKPKTCADLVSQPGCPRIIPPCPGGCVCKDGYLRSSNGTCIKREHCPSAQCTKPNERYSNCLLGECVPKTCCDVGYPVACPDIIGPCAGGCTCIEGFVRDYKGNCIDMKNCPSCGGEINAISGCGNPCGKTCASLYANNSDLVCPQYCEYNGCDCKPGYRLLNADNTNSIKCIPERECPKPPQQCDKKEQYYCGTSCPEATCANPTPRKCVNKKCKLGCFCKKGFVRNANNKCVPLGKCPPICKDPNASWKDCKDACAATCQNTRPNCVNIKCSAGCQCNDGYVLSKPGGKCVKIETCAEYAECGTNKTFMPCTFKCPQVKCPTSDITLLCKPPRDCPGGCGCKPYYRYNATGDCVKASDCPSIKCTRPNEKFTCQRAYSWERCEDRYNSPPFNPGHPDDCTPKCVCKAGFWRNDANKCVPADQCQTNGSVVTTPKPDVSVPQKCPENEVVKKRYLCPPDTCDSIYLSFLCVAEQNETLVCTCKDGYLRTNATGTCVPQDRCLPPKCADDPYAKRGCGNRCKKTCTDYNDTNKVCDNRVCKLFGCDCQDGFVYDEIKNKCVEPNQCTAATVCKDPNASWKDCMDACPGTCQNTKPTCVNKMCSPGCQCNDGYVLSKLGGECVKIETCADYAECDGNQTFVPCTHKCPQVKCPESDQITLCKPPRDCPGGCGCKPNYRYNADGECIKGSDCPPVECTRLNEEWAPCRSEYDWERCDDRFNSSPIIPSDTEDCNPRCVCKKGFWRNNAGDCVMESECPPSA